MQVAYDFALRGHILTFKENPFTVGDKASYVYYDDGILMVKLDKIIGIGKYNSFGLDIPSSKTITFDKQYLIMPGFIDTHLHYPQLEIIGGYGENLLEWLQSFAFKAEAKYSDISYAKKQAKLFLLHLIDNGITSAGIFCSSHIESIQALFEEADESGLNITAGQVWMDRSAPDHLLKSSHTSYEESEMLIKKWNNHGSLRYAITPRFPITSSPNQMEVLGDLARKYPNLTIQSHISENQEEVTQVKKLYPQFKNYASLYDHYRLLNSYAIYAHGNFLTTEELELLTEREASLAHCPSSNEFLGNQPLNICQINKLQPNLKIALASDIGAGTSLNPWSTMAAAYRASRTHNHALSSIKALYLHTLGGAKVLNIANSTGKLEAGYRADIAIINTHAEKLLSQRIQLSQSLEEELFILMMLGTTNTIARLYVAGTRLK